MGGGAGEGAHGLYGGLRGGVVHAGFGLHSHLARPRLALNHRLQPQHNDREGLEDITMPQQRDLLYNV